MTPSLTDLISYLTIGAYLFGAGAWAFAYRELKAVRAELVSLRIKMASDDGKAQGQDHERRITRLERLLNGKD